MGKVYPKEDESKVWNWKKRLRRSENKYFKPRALVHLQFSATSASKPCTDLGKKRVAVLDAKEPTNDDLAVQNKASHLSSVMFSPVDIVKQSNLVRSPSICDMAMDNKAFDKSPLVLSPMVMQSSLARIPKTPQAGPCNSDSRLESLPMDLLVTILCHLHHDQLRAAFHVSLRIREAVLLAKQYYFNYTTPDRSRQKLLSAMTPRPIDHWPFVGKAEDGNPATVVSPDAPQAPRHGRQPPCRVKLTEMEQITAALFHDQTFASRCMVPSVLHRPSYKPLASNRVLFYEDELCEAVAENKLR